MRAAATSASGATRGDASIASPTGGTSGHRLLPPVSADPSGTASTPLAQEMELLYWKDIQDSSDPVDFQGFLQQFPAGLYAGLAARRLRRLARSLVDGTGSQSVVGTSPFGSSSPGVASFGEEGSSALPTKDSSLAGASHGGSRPAVRDPGLQVFPPHAGIEATGSEAAAPAGVRTDDTARLAALRAAQEEALWQREQMRDRDRAAAAAAESTPIDYRPGTRLDTRRAGGQRPFNNSAFGAVSSSFIDLSTAPMPLHVADAVPQPMPVDTVPVELSVSARSRSEPRNPAPSTVVSPVDPAGSTPSSPPPLATPPEWPPRSERKSRVASSAVAGGITLIAVAAAWWAWAARDVTGATPARLAASPPSTDASGPGVAGAAPVELLPLERVRR